LAPSRTAWSPKPEIRSGGPVPHDPLGDSPREIATWVHRKSRLITANLKVDIAEAIVQGAWTCAT
jgi:hypothetical protein